MHAEIPKSKALAERVFAGHNEKDFASIALGTYHFQFANNPVYHDYCTAIHRTPAIVKRLEQIPFLPISFFKSHRVAASEAPPELVFTSSGTTGMTVSTHYVSEAALYEQSFLRGFERRYGPVGDWCILGLLPSYLERGGSSLVYMVEGLIGKSGHSQSGFYLHDFDRLNENLQALEAAGQKTLLIGVTYALLDFGQRFPQSLRHTVVLETGGMKGRRRELTREELYEELRAAFGVGDVHSEYGMTELLSQAYAVNGRFQTPPWMRLGLRDETDPLSFLASSAKPVTGAINVIDLVNLHSCSFIATEDSGRLHPDGSFEVLGRLDNTDIRGCSLLVV